MINVLCPVREKLVLLVPADLRAHRDPVERLVPQDLPDPPEHRFVCHCAHRFILDHGHSYIVFVIYQSVRCFLPFHSLCAQGNPGTDGIPGAKGSAVSLFSLSLILESSITLSCSVGLLCYVILIFYCPLLP